MLSLKYGLTSQEVFQVPSLPICGSIPGLNSELSQKGLQACGRVFIHKVGIFLLCISSTCNCAGLRLLANLSLTYSLLLWSHAAHWARRRGPPVRGCENHITDEAKNHFSTYFNLQVSYVTQLTAWSAGPEAGAAVSGLAQKASKLQLGKVHRLSYCDDVPFL